MKNSLFSKIEKIIEDSFMLFKWWAKSRIIGAGSVLPFEFIGILASIAIYYFYTLALTPRNATFEGLNPIHYIILGLFVRNLINVPIYLIHNVVYELYSGIFGYRGASLSIGDYLRIFKISIYSYILAELSTTYLREVSIAFLYLIVGVIFFGLSLPPLGNMLYILLAILLGFMASLGIGFIIASIDWLTGVLLMRSPIVWFLELIISIASGIYFPISLLPSWLRYFAYVLPHYYCIKITRTLFETLDMRILLKDFIILLMYSVGLIIIGTMVFHKAYKKKGLKGDLLVI